MYLRCTGNPVQHLQLQRYEDMTIHHTRTVIAAVVVNSLGHTTLIENKGYLSKHSLQTGLRNGDEIG